MKAGILQKGIGFQGDHRNIFVDLETKSFLGLRMYKILPPAMKTLQLNDSRTYKAFIKHLKTHLQETSLNVKSEVLFKKHPNE